LDYLKLTEPFTNWCRLIARLVTPTALLNLQVHTPPTISFPVAAEWQSASLEIFRESTGDVF